MKILIAGAGIAGLAAARAFERRGIYCHMVERHPELPLTGSGIFLLGNTTRALKNLGLLEEVEAVAQPIKSQNIYSSNGRLLNSVSTNDVWGECGPCLALPRHRLLTVLSLSLQNTNVMFGKTVVGIETCGDSKLVKFSDGTSANYDLVIGADGIRSTVRMLAFNAPPPRLLGISCWRMVVRGLVRPDDWTAMLGKNRTLLSIPVSDDETYIYADCPWRERPKDDLIALKEMFADFAAPLGPLVAGLDNTVISSAVLEEVPVRQWISDRLVLIGDAAHASSPSMAQGAGMAIEDAVVLASLFPSTRDLAVDLQEFSERRMERITWVQKQCHSRDSLRNSPGVIRDTALRILGNKLYSKAYTPLTKPIDTLDNPHPSSI